jgi:hypothetical protein
MYEPTRCDNCEFRDECELRDITNFCEDCRYYHNCTIHTEYCLNCHEIECNNGFEEIIIDDTDSDDDYESFI